MKTIVEHNMDKKRFPDGPWQSEPDKIQWLDPATGFPCLIVRNRMGAWCGYVGVPPTHPAYNKKYDDVPVDAHGGLTFAGACQSDGGICHVVEEGESDDVWWLGFDCAHYNDVVPSMLQYDGNALFKDVFKDAVYRDQNFVKQEVEYLAEQLKQLEEKVA